MLCTVNARFQHAAFGLRYLLANMGELEPSTLLKEFSLGVRERDIVEQILECEPTIVGLSVYIWNVEVLTTVAELLRALRPSLTLVIGGPEVSHEWEGTRLFGAATYLVRGEGDVAFADLCRQILANRFPTDKVLPGGLPPLIDLKSPYSHYTAFDLEHGRIIYVEASRGCPFSCHFCLSSLDRSVRSFELGAFLLEMERLLERGVRQFKFVDRTFNLKSETSERILGFFLERYVEGMFLHFEMIPDRLPEGLKPLICAFPPGVLQFEVGIQSFNKEVCARIGRRQNFRLIEENLTFLKESSGVHVHADLIAGLPGEDLQSFANGFDALVALGPSEIQVGILKRLKGTPITLAEPEWAMVYAGSAPYEVLQTSHLSFYELQRLSRFSRYWDLIGNSGRFLEEVPSLLGEQPFDQFMAFSDWLYAQLGSTSGIALGRLRGLVGKYLSLPSRPLSIDRKLTAAPKRGESSEEVSSEAKGPAALPKRQRRRVSISTADI